VASTAKTAVVTRTKYPSMACIQGFADPGRDRVTKAFRDENQWR
jgi:hypothetical protein